MVRVCPKCEVLWSPFPTCQRFISSRVPKGMCPDCKKEKK